jgi:hypothetical protein
MRFLWFGKKKVKAAQVSSAAEEARQEVYSVSGFICETNPDPTSRGSELNAHTINSAILSVLSEASSPADLAAQEFFQERGAIVLPISEYGFTAERGFSARVIEGDIKRTVLIGNPVVIALATTPFCPSIKAAVTAEPGSFVVAIDGIAYASFGITKEFI